jgi:predicted nucleic acid-binding protein
MKYLFDASAIFKAIKENKIDLLIGNHTLEIARYELGNILWKNYSLLSKATDQEIRTLAKIIKQTLNLMEITQIKCTEEEILETAIKLRVTFYDATYAYHAKAKELALITEDLQLQKKITPYVNSSKIDDIIKQQNKLT